MTGFGEYVNVTLSSKRDSKFIDQLSNFHILEKGFTLWCQL
jgi:hypothetical protein